MKKLSIITFHKSTAFFHKKELQSAFGKNLEIEAYCLENINKKIDIDGDLLLISSYEILDMIKPWMEKDTEFVIMKRTLTMDALNKIKEIPDGSEVMLVNSSKLLALETIAQIYELGIRDINLMPVYPELEELPDIKIAVTPGEVKYVPRGTEQIIDIQNRIIDLTSITDIMARLGFALDESQDILKNYINVVAPMSYGVRKLLDKSNILKRQLEVILNITDHGIIAINTDGIITECNQLIIDILELSRDDIIGKMIDKLLPQLKLEEVLDSRETKKNQLMKINDQVIVLENYPILYEKELMGAFSIIREFSEMEKNQQKLRNRVVQKGHVAQYTFFSIIGNSDILNKTKVRARKMARSDSTILISGESGTGKELFAQAIHNASPRKERPFVALNCSALTETLLESELFGYEAGAFTGARKKGKLGLFELAHTGTIFLDEIGEISLKLQAKLLRVLEEKKLIKVGGNSLIDIDVRIIAASNKDLKKLVNEKKFREDLYYRLNVLPLTIPPLRNRREDIPLLIKDFLEKNRYKKELNEDIMKKLIKYDWKGNIRELENCIEYMVQMTEGEITGQDLPPYVYEEEEYLLINYKLSKEEIIIVREINQKPVNLKVMEILQKAKLLGEKRGRRSILSIMNKRGLNISDYELRKVLSEINKEGLIEIGRGREGTIITEKGNRIIKGMKSVN